MSRHDFEICLGHDTFLLPSGEGYVLYAPRLHRAFRTSPAQTDLLTSRLNDPKVLAQHLAALIGADILDNDRSREETVIYQPITVALMLTSACQLRCSYCYAEAGNTPTANLDVSVAKHAIDYVAQNASARGQPTFSVHIHGAGEPTLRGNAIRELLDYARSVANDRGLAVRSLMSTNFAVNEDDALYYVRNIDAIHVSCDGPPDIMAASRGAAKGNSRAHQLTYHALSSVAAKELMHKVVVRCTVTKHSRHRLVEIVEFFHRLGVKAIYMVGVSTLGRGASEAAVDARDFVRDFRAAKNAARDLGLQLHYPGVDVDRVRVDGYGCGISGSNFVVLPDGDVSLCYEAVVPHTQQRTYFSIGRIARSEIDIAEERVQQIREATHVDKRHVCATCFCRLTCAGQCAARNFSAGEQVRDVCMTSACDITRTLTMDAVQSELLQGV